MTLRAPKFKVCPVMLLLAPFLCAQQPQQIQQQEQVQRVAGAAPAADLPAKPPKEAAQERQAALQMLEISESEGRGFEPPMRTYTLLQIAQTLTQIDQAKAGELLKDAFTASLGIQDDDQLKGQLQEEILRSLLPISQADVEERLPQAELNVRVRTAGAIIGRYVEKKQFEPAMELIRQITGWDEFPYAAGTTLLLAMPPDMAAEKLAVFSEALNSFKNHDHKNILVGDGTFTSLIVRFGAKMPAKMVLEAIDEILSQSKKNAEQASITVGGSTGTAAFGSFYEYELFAMLPLLQQLDEGRAKSLLEQNQALQAKLAQFPLGLKSIDPGMKDTPGDHGMHTSISTGNSRGLSNVDYMAQETMRKAQQIVEDSSKDPMQSIAQAMTLPSTLGNGRVAPKANALEAIARRSSKQNPEAAREALSDLRKAIVDLPLKKQAQFLGSAADLYLRIGDQDSAEKAVGEGLKLADKILETDINPDDPNKALKAWWPSVDAYRRFIEVETKISRRAAVKTLREIKDPEIRTVESIMVSRAMLDLPWKTVKIVERRKTGTSSTEMSNSD